MPRKKTTRRVKYSPLPTVYSNVEIVAETAATLALEGLDLTDGERALLASYVGGKLDGDVLRVHVISEAGEAPCSAPDPDVLNNKLGITDRGQLDRAERELTMLRTADLIRNPLDGPFDLEHLKTIHRALFQDLYGWAGKVRTVNIAKGIMFCNVMFIGMQADRIFGELKAANFLAGLPQEEFTKKLAYFFSEINALHPFREGNGRTQREFARALAVKNGYVLTFDGVTEDEMVHASLRAFIRKFEEMEALFERCVKRHNKIK